MSRPRIAALLTVYNRLELTRSCLASVTGQIADADIDVYLVDDGSTDGTAEMVRTEFPTVHLLRGDGNLFWNGGMRMAFAAAIRRDYDHYLWLNDDTRLDEGSVATLLGTHTKLSRRLEAPVIVVGATREPGSSAVSYGGRERRSRLRPLHFSLVEPAPDPRECETMNGNSVLVPRAVAQRVGNIDPSYRQQMGDLDYGLRARRAGCTVWLAPGTVGECASNPSDRPGDRPIRQEWRALRSTKSLQPGAWRTFARRWGGPLWPLYWASPYVQLPLRVALGRMGRPGRECVAGHRSNTTLRVGVPRKVPVVGVPVSLTSYDEVLRLVDRGTGPSTHSGDRPADRALTVGFATVHSVMTARRDPEVRRALEHLDIATSDGMPLVWALRRLGSTDQARVYGPDFMELALRHGVERGWRHYFYGATPETLQRLRAAVTRIAPGVQVVGWHAPPFRPLTGEERAASLEDIRASGANLVWVGLGMPKQELWVDNVRDELPGTALLAVGAAFDLLAGTVRQAPDWMQDRGLEWVYRLCQEPRRLWRRYLFNNPAFLVLAGHEAVVARLPRRSRA